MEENLETTKISFCKNLSTISFNTVISVPIDSNVNIKNILDISSYLYDEKIECMNTKAIVNGKIGLKILYIDTDNMTNTLTDNQSFSESFVDPSISSESFIVLNNTTIQNTVLSNDGTLKINCEVSLKPTMYMNLALNTNLNSNENLITRKSEIKTASISNKVCTAFDYTSTIETKDTITKILCHNSYFNLTNSSAKENAIMVEGKIHSCILYETTVNDETVIKELHDTFNLKTDIAVDGINSEDSLDICVEIDKSKDHVTIETEEDSNTIVIDNKIKVCGVTIKEVAIDIVDDVYSTQNELESTSSSREYFSADNTIYSTENVYGEVVLSNEETAIDDLITNLNINPEITNVYIKDGNVYVEGLISSSVAYLDENKEYKQKLAQVPFIINSKHEVAEFASSSANVTIEDCKFKAKRGTIIELEYNLNLKLKLYKKQTIQIIDNIILGKQLDFSAYDYQIYIAKPNETMWDLCKRTKCSLEDILKQNKDLPNIMNGGERVIIKR